MRRLLALGIVLAACSAPASDRGASAQPAAAGDDAETTAARAQLVSELRAEGIEDEAVLSAIGRVPRHRFVPPDQRGMAYVDLPLPIGHEQTISQPYVVALMTQLAQLAPPCRVLEVGTGSGYQAAVLDELGCEVFSIEIVEPLAREAEERLEALGYDRVHVRAGDGYAGWPDEGPFDAILITAAPPDIPEPLPPQLRTGGRLIAPIGGSASHQELVVLRRTRTGYERRTETLVLFVPMTGEAQERR